MHSPGQTPQGGQRSQAGWHALCHLVTFTQAQRGLQLGAGFLGCSLFTFVKVLRFPESCLAATGHLIASTSLAAEQHIGVRLACTAEVVGGSLWGLCTGAVVLSASLPATGHAHTAVLCVLCVIALALLSIIRTACPPPQGMLGCAFFGILIIIGHTLPTHRLIWLAAAYLQADICVGALMASIMACVMLPSLAVDEVHAASVRTLRGVGRALSGYGSRLFKPEDAQPPGGEGVLHSRPSLLPPHLQQPRQLGPAAAAASSGAAADGTGKADTGGAAGDVLQGDDALHGPDAEIDRQLSQHDDLFLQHLAAQLQHNGAMLEQAAGSGGASTATPATAAAGQGQPMALPGGDGGSASASSTPPLSGISLLMPMASLMKSGFALHWQEDERSSASSEGRHERWPYLDLLHMPLDDDELRHDSALLARFSMATKPPPLKTPKKAQPAKAAHQPRGGAHAPPPAHSSGAAGAPMSPRAAPALHGAPAGESPGTAHDSHAAGAAGAQLPMAPKPTTFQPAGQGGAKGAAHGDEPTPLPAPNVVELRPALARAKGLLAGAVLEPLLFIRPGARRFDPACWGALLAGLGALVTCVAALECVLEEEVQVAGDASLAGLLTFDIIPQFRAAFARVAADCERLARALEAHGLSRRTPATGHVCSPAEQDRAGAYRSAGGKGAQGVQEGAGCDPASDLRVDWSGTVAELRQGLLTATYGYWRRVRAEHAQLVAWHSRYGQHSPPAPSRDGAALGGPTSATAAATGSTDAALPMQPTPSPSSAASTAPSPLSPPHLHLVNMDRNRGLMYLWDVTQDIIAAMQKVEEAAGKLLLGDAGAQGGRPAAQGGGSAAAPPGTGQKGQQAAGKGAQGSEWHASAAGSAAAVAHAVPAAAAAAPAETGQVCSSTSTADAGAPKGASDAACGTQQEGGAPAGQQASKAAGSNPMLAYLVLVAVALGQRCLGWLLFKSMLALAVTSVPPLLTAAGWRRLLADRSAQAAIKFWVAASGALVLVIALIEPHDRYRLSAHEPIFFYSTVVACMTDRVEATASKVVLRIAGTVVGGVLGFLLMMNTHLATNPYALAAITTVITSLVGVYLQGAYRYAWTLVPLTLHSLVLCQYVGCCGATGSTNLFLSRIVMVAIGGTVPTMLNQLVLPWYTTEWSLETMAGVLREMSGMLNGMYDEFINETYAHALRSGCAVTPLRALTAAAGGDGGAAASAMVAAVEAAVVAGSRGGAGAVGGEAVTPSSALAGDDGEAAASAAPPKQWLTDLEKRVAGPLVAVQASLMRDTVQWRRGVLSTPPVVNLVLGSELVLLDRLAAVAMVTSSTTVVTGTRSGWTYEYLLAPLHCHFTALMADMQALAQQVTAILSGGRRGASDAQRQAVMAALRRLYAQRIRARKVVMALRKRRHHLFMRLPEDQLPHFINADDAVRVYAFLYTMTKAIDKLMSLARALVSAECMEREDITAWLK